jgi:iron complex outermembrane receptor protein
MRKFTLLCATSAFVMPAMLSAQSTGSIEIEEEEEIVVTGARTQGVEGIVVPDSTKAKGVLTQEIIQRANPGQSILNTINIIPGVNFTNADPYGSSGGNIRIRGFDGNRISLTFDGLPLNDSGNYAIFSNQQLDPELIEQVNVNLGTTDVDSPTASAAGGTVNYRTIIPRRELGARVSGSAGDDEFARVFGLLESGELTSWGTRAFIAASNARNDKFKGPGKIHKQQYNARLYQPVGDGGDFISISGHWNKNRNNFYRNPSIADLRTVFNGAPPLPPFIPLAANISSTNPLVVGEFSRAQEDSFFEDPRLENDPICGRDIPQRNVADNDGSTSTAVSSHPGFAPSACTNFFNLRINPSNTGNIRGNSRFTLSDSLVLTVDPSFQYVLANGGGTTNLSESASRVRGSTPASPGVDFNGDGDFLDTVRFYTPNITNTHRYGLTASLIWDINDQHRVRVAYTYDRAHHRQTGEWGFLDGGGNPESPFSGRNARPVLAADGYTIQQRDRTSIALLNQVAGQYIGEFMDERLRVEVGLRAPFFRRDLETFCHIQARDGFALCTSEPIPAAGTPGATLVVIGVNDPVSASGNPVPLYAPFKAKYKFDAILPNVGFSYDFGGGISVFGSYAKGFSAPRTDNLYRAPIVDIDPEKTDAFDLGLRYSTSQVQAQGTAWIINYANRIVSSFNQDLGISIDRNVGKVNSYGFDGSIAYKPDENVMVYLFGAYISAEFQEDIEIGRTNAPTGGATVPAGTLIIAPTKGKMVSETPKWQLGARGQFTVGPVEFGAQAKWVDSRWATDVNDVKVKAYTVVDLDARLSLAKWGLEKTYFQVNVHNLFNEFYFGNLSTQINAGNICPVGATCAANSANPNFSVGSPRTFLATINVGF